MIKKNLSRPKKVPLEPEPRSPGPRILIADPDQRTLIQLRDHLRSRGYEIIVTRDGAKALEVAITQPPDMIILSTDIPSIPTHKFTEIIRSNPRIQKTPIIFIGDDYRSLEDIKTVKDSFISKPVNLMEISSQIEQILRRIRQVEEVYSGEKEITGTVTQIPLVDLLQVLTLNRREGKVIVRKSEADICEIFVRDGMIVNATLRDIEGEKSLFRALTWKEGKFEFIPVQIPGPVRTTFPTGKLLLEGMRQADEMERFSQYLPDPDTILSLQVDQDSLPPGLRPIIQEILLLLEFYNRVQDVVDHCSFPDYEVYRALHSLIRKSLVAETKPDIKISRPESYILEPADAQKLKQIGGEKIRILFFSSSIEGAKILIRALTTLPEFHLEEGAANNFKIGTPSLGSLGRLRSGDDFSIQIIALPLEPEFHPLWQVTSQDTIGALLFLPPEADQHFPYLKSAQEFLSLLRFGPQQENVRVLGITEAEDSFGPASPYSQLELDQIIPLSPGKPASTRNLFRQLLLPPA